MTRKATDIVTKISIDIGKNRLHLIGLEGGFGSTADQQTVRRTGPLSEVKQTKSVEKPTSRPNFRC